MASNSEATALMREIARMRSELGVAPYSIADNTITKFCKEISEFKSMERRQIKETNPAWDKFWEN